MGDQSGLRIVHAYIATLNMPYISKYSWAYGLLVRTSTAESWYWGVKNLETQFVDTEMFGLRRLLLAVALRSSDQEVKVRAFMRGTFLRQRLGMASKKKRDIQTIERDPSKTKEEKEEEIEAMKLHNHDAWLETATLWDVYGEGMREAIEESELGYLGVSAQHLNRMCYKIPSPFKTHLPFLESPGELTF